MQLSCYFNKHYIHYTFIYVTLFHNQTHKNINPYNVQELKDKIRPQNVAIKFVYKINVSHKAKAKSEAKKK